MKHLTLLLFSAILTFAQAAQPDQQQNSGDARQRVRAVREMAAQGQEAIPKIAPYLRDIDITVRLETVKALDDIGGPKTVDALVEAARDHDAEMQIRAADGLVNVYLPGYLKTGITGSLKRAGDSVRAKFTDTNDQIIDSYVEVPAPVIEVLGRQARAGASLDSRANAARALGILRGQAAIPDLLEALNSKEGRLMYESLIALQKIRDPAAGPGLAFLLRDLDEKVQLAALEATGILRNQSAAPDVRDVLNRARTPKVRREALTTLAMLADPADHGVFLRYLSDRDAALRGAAAEGLARLKDSADRPAVEKGFETEGNANARVSMAFAAVSLGNRQISEFSPLQYLLNTLNTKAYRNVAIAFLTELARDLEIRQAIYPILTHATRDEKTGMSVVLARSGDRDSEPYLEALVKDSDPEVMQEGTRSLRTLRTRVR
ncbi:MAG: lyase domain protein repeat-containing protein [Bryobacterales bacterium]|nr:lyase domain protein repeat-containing protein [Bryobacterales bacterium]